MRTEGVFQNKGCVTYEVIQEAREDEGYYKFADFVTGVNRAYTEFYFGDNEFVMDVYTNKFNRVKPLELHSRWTATLGNRDSAAEGRSLFHYPQPIMVKDFTSVFDYMSESIYYTFENDPYSSASQPRVGTVTVGISVDDSLPLDDSHELFLLLTTDSLFDGGEYNKENLKFIRKYVYLPVGQVAVDTSIDFVIP